MHQYNPSFNPHNNTFSSIHSDLSLSNIENNTPSDAKKLKMESFNLSKMSEPAALNGGTSSLQFYMGEKGSISEITILHNQQSGQKEAKENILSPSRHDNLYEIIPKNFLKDHKKKGTNTHHTNENISRNACLGPRAEFSFSKNPSAFCSNKSVEQNQNLMGLHNQNGMPLTDISNNQENRSHHFLSQHQNSVNLANFSSILTNEDNLFNITEETIAPQSIMESKASFKENNSQFLSKKLKSQQQQHQSSTQSNPNAVKKRNTSTSQDKSRSSQAINKKNVKQPKKPIKKSDNGEPRQATVNLMDLIKDYTNNPNLDNKIKPSKTNFLGKKEKSVDKKPQPRLDLQVNDYNSCSMSSQSSLIYNNKSGLMSTTSNQSQNSSHYQNILSKIKSNMKTTTTTTDDRKRSHSNSRNLTSSEISQCSSSTQKVMNSMKVQVDVKGFSTFEEEQLHKKQQHSIYQKALEKANFKKPNTVVGKTKRSKSTGKVQTSDSLAQTLKLDVRRMSFGAPTSHNGSKSTKATSSSKVKLKNITGYESVANPRRYSTNTTHSGLVNQSLNLSNIEPSISQGINESLTGISINSSMQTVGGSGIGIKSDKYSNTSLASSVNYTSLTADERALVEQHLNSGNEEGNVMQLENETALEADQFISHLKGNIRKLMIKTDINTKAIHKLKQIKEVENARINLYRSKLNYMLENYMAEALYQQQLNEMSNIDQQNSVQDSLLTDQEYISIQEKIDETPQKVATTSHNEIENNSAMQDQIKEQKIMDLQYKVKELQAALENKQKEKDHIEQVYSEVVNRSETEEMMNSTLNNTSGAFMTQSNFNKTMDSNAPQTTEIAIQTSYREMLLPVISQLQSSCNSCTSTKRKHSFPKIRGIKTSNPNSANNTKDEISYSSINQ